MYVNATQMRNKWIAGRAARGVKEGTSAVLVQSGLDEKLAGRFCGMLLPLAKYSGSFVGWEDTR